MRIRRCRMIDDLRNPILWRRWSETGLWLQGVFPSWKSRARVQRQIQPSPRNTPRYAQDPSRRFDRLDLFHSRDSLLLDLRGDYDDYVQDPRYPWPHSFIVQDIVQAFAMIAMFLPNSNVTKLVTMFVNSSQWDEFRKSGVFDPKERSKVRPDRRTRPSYKFRDKELWKE
ncbi:hypothetical protein AU210_008585 [Fusarium oxysporum f. sp. radicis-cucumerinum]|uniref:Uncharacterized protein n=1 Tax=Fusarium oxysporum f. sp. radicis-cucumerinum TaxID=327505 RepID=A0A2H3HEP9_FUSOX|nr:hypothetical protein AU210_008585 [Fusarium oxysporum f. sp. radicis-cucumerinum]